MEPRPSAGRPAGTTPILTGPRPFSPGPAVAGAVQSPPVKIYTRGGDDGTTGLLFGGRAAKDQSGPEACGAVDEAVSALGVARAAASGASAGSILEVQRDLFVAGAELATAVGKRSRLQPGVSLVTAAMVERLETAIDALDAEVGMPTGFVVPGGNAAAAALDQARSVVRRAERRAVAHLRAEGIEGSLVVPFLNRLGDYLYMLARAAEGEWTPSRREE
jgi:cob(I)alamin adenosyltransferase